MRRPARATVRTTLLTVGRVRAPFAEADAHYRKLLSRYLPLEVVEARDDAELLRRLPERARVVAIDREGRPLDSIGWSRWLRGAAPRGAGRLPAVGGP